eukprot:2985921-Pyramimonas_sp.AAC.2
MMRWTFAEGPFPLAREERRQAQSASCRCPERVEYRIPNTSRIPTHERLHESRSASCVGVSRRLRRSKNLKNR